MLNTFSHATRCAAFCFLAVPAIFAPTAEAGAAAPVKVEITNYVFEPKVLTIAPGTEVIWVNHDADPHTIVSAADQKLLTSPVLDTNETFSFVFRDSGSFAYYCSVHPHMQGVIVVK